jgi:hypothetical protein
MDKQEDEGQMVPTPLTGELAATLRCWLPIWVCSLQKIKRERTG